MKMDWTAIYVLIAAAMVLAMWAGHWFPWKYYFGCDLSRIGAYIYGTAWVIGIPLIIAAWMGQIEVAGMFAAAASGAGLATIVAHRMDDGREKRHRELEEQERLRRAAGGK